MGLLRSSPRDLWVDRPQRLLCPVLHRPHRHSRSVPAIAGTRSGIGRGSAPSGPIKRINNVLWGLLKIGFVSPKSGLPAQILRIWLCHPCWPLAKSRHLKSKSRRFGNPPRFQPNVRGFERLPCPPGDVCRTPPPLRASARVQLLLQAIKPRYSIGQPTASPTVCIVRFCRGERVHDSLRCQ